MKLKALSVRQPYADLIVDGVKTVETRTWTTSYRGPLAIHAAMHLDGVGERVADSYGLNADALVRGAIVGVVQLVAVEPSAAVRISRLKRHGWEQVGDHVRVASAEQHLGNLFAGFVWLLDGPERLLVPYRTRGAIHLWDVKLPQ